MDSGSTYKTVSSDALKKGFDAAVKQAVKDGTSVIGYDKNVPDSAGLNKMLKVRQSIC